jgi:thiol-disulfide isomerase/thioredoxin
MWRLLALAVTHDEPLDHSTFAGAKLSADTAFLRFYAPWCAHCRAVAPAWEELVDSEEFEGTRSVLIGSINCADEVTGGKALCSRFGIDLYSPRLTLRYFLPGDTIGEVYDGDRTLTALTAFARSLADLCVPSRLDSCTDEQRSAILPFFKMAMPTLRSRTVQYKLLTKDARDTAMRLAAEYHQQQAAAPGEHGEQQQISKKERRQLEQIAAQIKESAEALASIEAEKGAEFRRARAVELFREPQPQHLRGAARRTASKDEV